MLTLKGAQWSYAVDIKKLKDPLLKLHNTDKRNISHLKKLLDEMKGFKLFETLRVSLKSLPNRKSA